MDRRHVLLVAALVLIFVAVGGVGIVRLREDPAPPPLRIEFGLRVCGARASIADVTAFEERWTADEPPKPFDVPSADLVPLGAATLRLHGVMTRQAKDRAVVRVSKQVGFQMRRGTGGPTCEAP